MALPTPESVMASAIADDTEVMVCVPTFVEAWSRAPEGVAFLQKLKGVVRILSLSLSLVFDSLLNGICVDLRWWTSQQGRR